MNFIRLSFAAVITAAFFTVSIHNSLCGQTVTVEWLNPVSGNWTDATKWSTSPLYPNNGSPAPTSHYDVELGAMGGGTHTVTLANNITLDALHLTSPNVILEHTAGILNVGEIDLVNGTYRLKGGTIRNAIISDNGLATFLAASSSTSNLTSVVLNTDLDMQNGATIQAAGGLAVVNGHEITLNASRLHFSGNPTFGGSGTVVFKGGNDSSPNWIKPTNGTLTIGPDITVRAAIGSLSYIGTDGLGTINQSDVQIESASSLTMMGNWTNTGTFKVNGGDLRLDGYFTRSAIGNIERNGGNITLTGMLNLENETVDISNVVPGLLRFQEQGMLIDGTIRVSDPSKVSFGGLTLGIITIDSDIYGTGGYVQGGLTINAGKSFYISGGWNFQFNQTLKGPGEIVFNGESAGITSGDFYSASSTLTIAPETTVRTGTHGGSISRVINYGTIISQTAGQSLRLGERFENHGVIQLSDGTLELYGAITLPKLGTVQRTGGSVHVLGELDLLGGTLQLDDTTGSWDLKRGAIKNGIITTAGSAHLGFAPIESTQESTLRDVTIATDLTILSNSPVVLSGDVTLQDSDIEVNPFGKLKVYGQILGTGNLTLHNASLIPNGTAIIGPGINVSTDGDEATIGESYWGITNRGTITIDEPSHTLNLTGNWRNENQLNVLDGTLEVTGNWTNAGTISLEGGAIRLGGSFTTPGLGTFNRIGGTVELLGTLNNTNQTLLLNDQTGSWILSTGKIVGGIVRTTESASLQLTSFPSNSDGFSELDGVYLDTDLELPDGGGVQFRNGLTLEDRTITLASQGARTRLISAANQTLGGDGEIVFDGASHQNYLYPSSGTLTLGEGILIRTGTSGGFVGKHPNPGGGSSGVINYGVISAETPGKHLSIAGGTTNPIITNHGVIQALNGAILTMGGNWSNDGQINNNQSTLNLDGLFYTAGIGTINRIGGEVNLTGTMVNTGATFALTNETTGMWNLRGGTILGGTFQAPAGEVLHVFTTNTKLDGVAMDADLFIENGARLRVINGGTLKGGKVTIAAIDSSTSLEMAGNQDPIDPLEIIFNGASPLGVVRSVNSTLTLGSKITVRSGTSGGGVGGSDYSVRNYGTILSSTSGKTINFAGIGSYNFGLLEATNGGRIYVEALLGGAGHIVIGENSQVIFNTGNYTLENDLGVPAGSLFTARGIWTNTASIQVNDAHFDLEGTWKNNGQIHAADAEIHLAGSSQSIGNFVIENSDILVRNGAFSSAQIDQIDYSNSTMTIGPSGTINNTSAQIALDAVTGSWVMGGGTINGGTIIGTDNATLLPTPAGGLLNQVTLNLDVTIPGNAYLSINERLTLTDSTLALSDDALLTFVGSGTERLAGNGSVVFNGVNDTILVTAGASTSTLRIESPASIRTGSSGGTINIPDKAFVNAGSILAGTPELLKLNANSITNLGKLEATDNGKIEITVAQAFSSSGEMAIGIGGVIDISGSLTLTMQAKTGFDIGSEVETGSLHASSDLVLAGILQIQLAPSFVPTPGTEYHLIDSSTLTGTFESITGQDIGNGFFFDPVYSPTSFTLVVDQTSQGDADFDGDIDLNDLSTLAANYGTPSGALWSQGDYDGDGDVDLNDLSILAANYGSGEAQAFADFASLAVPEPSTAGIIALGLLLAGRRRQMR